MQLKEKKLRRRVRANEVGELKEKTVNIARVAKVVKGGKRFSFTALVVTGDGRGHVGAGLGKAGEVPDAIRKATERAKKTLIKVPLRGSTIPHEVVGDFGPTKVLLKPAAPGSGVIAGSAVRAVLESAGIKDIKTKVIGSTNSHNVLHAVLSGLLQLRDPEVVGTVRNLNVQDMGYSL
ncbi:MAG: 30S ribosomal protein S5 [Bdellovibrionota bacterium]|nr:MAG: 30S ribosomal protein S5 [Bdellovibrionota bacterium]